MVLSVKNIFPLLLAALLPVLSFAQKSDLVEDSTITKGKTIYRKDFALGAFIHTNGFGASFRRGFYRGATLKNFYGIEAMNYKNNKEHKSFNPINDDSRGFIYGKLNSLFMVKGFVGQHHVMFRKEVKKGVDISYVYGLGITLGILKPEYLEVSKPGIRGDVSSIERYDPDKHTLDQIRGRGPILKGIDQSTIEPGLNAKFALNFDFGQKNDGIKALETGVNLDVFRKDLPIMANEQNKSFFFTVYLSVALGKKVYF